MPELKILCTADLHLGRSSACLGSPDNVDTTSVGAWQRMVKLAVDEQAHAVVIAGDVFDGTASYYETRKPFQDGLAILERAGILVAAVAGNHDWESLPRFARQSHPANLHFLGANGTWETIEIETAGGPLRIVGWSFPRERVPQSHLEGLSSGSSATPTLGIVHGDIAPKSNYHPIAAADFGGKADAWVLGHVHGAREVAPNIQYPGSPQALDFGPSERGPHGFKWLTLTATKAEFSDLVPVSTVRFEESDTYVEPSDQEGPWDAAYRVAEQRTRAWKAEQAGVESVQLRSYAVFARCGEKLTVPAGHEMSLDGRDAIAFTGYRVRPGVDPWDLVETPRAKGVIAKLLLGLRRSPLDVEHPKWNPDWVVQADELVRTAAPDVLTYFNRTLQPVTDEGDMGRLPPDESESARIARASLIRELESMLHEQEARA